MLKKCNCNIGPAAKFQDDAYGFGIRVHTPALGPQKTVVGRCTVCGNLKSGKGK